MIKITFFLLFFIWSSLIGATDAILYSKTASDAFKWNEHIVFTFQRMSVALLVLTGFFLEDLTQLIGVFISCVFCFSWFHNGVYYETRRRIDVPSYNFFSSSSTSTSVIELSFIRRTALLIIGILIAILSWVI